MKAFTDFVPPLGWQRLEDSPEPDSIIRLHKNYASEPDVILSIQKRDEGFVVVSNAESRTSGPNISELGTFATIEIALDTMVNQALKWDEKIEKLEKQLPRASQSGAQPQNELRAQTHIWWIAIGTIIGLLMGAVIGYYETNSAFSGIYLGGGVGLLVGGYMYRRAKPRK